MVRVPAAISPASRSAVSDSGERRVPDASSMSGGFHIAIRRAAFGAPSDSTSANSVPISRSASSTGLAIVAEARMKRGSAPYSRATRRKRRMTFATCEPNTPR